MAQSAIFQAISTKFFGASNTKGARIQAKTGSGKKAYFDYTYELNTEGEHRRAAELMAEKMGWKGELIGGGTEEGFVWVFLNIEGTTR